MSQHNYGLNGLNVCVPPDSYVDILTPAVMVLWGN